MMVKRRAGIFLAGILLLLAFCAGAMLISLEGPATATARVEEVWDYPIGTAPSSWDGGVGFVSSGWAAHDTGAVITNGLSFGKMAVRGNAVYIPYTAGSAFSSSSLSRTLSTPAVVSGDLWMAYLIRFDTDRSTRPADERIEIRPGAGSIRNGIDENLSAMNLRYGSVTTVSDPNALIKSGETLLFVFKYSDLGQTTGGDSRGWALTAGDYNSIVSSGITEDELNAAATLFVSAPFPENLSSGITFAGTEVLQMVPVGRNNSTPSFVVDEFRMGTSLGDVVALQPVGEGIASVLDGEFDPWDTVTWSNWYDNCGQIVKPFVIDANVTFATNCPGGVWRPALSGPVHLFELLENQNRQIDGNGIVIDVCLPQVGDLTIEEYYAASRSGADPILDYTEDWVPWTCFYVAQGARTITAGTTFENFQINGFYIGFETAHKQQRTVTVRNCEFYRNAWAFFTRGKNVTCVSNTVAESFIGGVYGEYGSCDWVFDSNAFYDNQVSDMGQSYADIVLDSCYNYLIVSNEFGPASVVNVPRHHTAISMFRNAGEALDIREHAVHDILVQGNEFSSYHLAVDIAARAGRVDIKDTSLEGRCYVHDIVVDDNRFTNCAIGIKVNSDRHDLTDNMFSGCDRDIVLHCVFYKNINNLISQENGQSADIWLWSQSEDFEEYAEYCFYQNDGGASVHESITDDQKIFHVVTNGLVTVHAPSRGVGEPPFTAQVIAERDMVFGDSIEDMYASGATPIDIAVGDYAKHIEGDEVAVIWDAPNSTLNEGGVSNAYYSIIIYDQWGLELDRCGRSTRRWARIAAGNLLEGKGYIHEDDEAEIAAIHSEAENGTYPVYVFRRGYALDQDYIDADRVVKLLPDNTLPWVDLAVGNFTTNTDEYEEIALVSSSPSSGSEYRIHYCKPSDASWSGQTADLPHPMHIIAAGNFDDTDSLDEIAGTYPGTLGLSSYPVDLFKVGDSGGYVTGELAVSSSPWDGIAAGNFDPADDAEEVAVALSAEIEGVCQIRVYDPENKYFKKFAAPIMGGAVAALDAGSINISTNGLATTEMTVGSAYEENDAEEITSWGDFIAVLPSEPQTSSIPLFWTSVDPASGADMFWRTVPLYR